MREFGNISPLAWRNDVELQQSCNTSNIPPNTANDDINNTVQTTEDQPEADEPQQYVKLTVDDMRKWAAMDQQARNDLGEFKDGVGAIILISKMPGIT